MLVCLMRHGEAMRAGPFADADRPLTRRGEAGIEAAALGLARLGLAPTLVAASPAERCRSTASMVARTLGAEVRVFDVLAGGPAEEVVRALSPWADATQLFLVGHAPDLSALAVLLTGERSGLHLGCGSCAGLESDAWPPRARAKVIWIRSVAELSALGKPARD